MGNGNMTIGRYDFEVADSKFIKIRDATKFEADTEEFIRRLGGPTAVEDDSEAVASTEIDDADRKALSAYVLANHRAVKWYQDKRDTMRERRTGYALLSIAVLALTPIVIFGLTKLLPANDEGSPAVWLSQATALVGGLMAAHRAIAAWLDKTFAAANFVQAAAALKANIYAFEEDWRDKAFATEKLTDECREALGMGIRAARDIVAKQRDDFFAASAPSNVDIASSLVKASKDTAALFGAFQSPALRRALGEEKATQTRLAAAASLREEINELNEQNKLLDALIEKLDRELLATTDDARKKTLQDRVNSVKKTRDKNEDALIKKAGSIAALVATS